MAEGTIRSKDILECAVCLQTCVHPAQLPCGHIFCYLCVKGFANQNKRCAMCRQEIPRDFIEQPHLLHVLQPLDEVTESFDGAYQWFYEGRNGWWQYDERTSKELENSYKNGDKTVELLIAGFLYIIDFENMLQLRRNDPSRRRQVKRDVATIAKKGVAGIRTNSSSTTSAQAEEETSSSNNAESSQTPDTPFNTPQRCTSGRESPNHHHDHEHELEAAVQLISNLRLDNSNNNNNNNLSSSDAETNHHQE